MPARFNPATSHCLGLAAAALIGASAVQAAAQDSPYAASASAAGAQAVVVTPRPDGGVIVGGQLDGRQFALAIPKAWNHQTLLFAHGYSAPDSSVAVAADPIAQDPALGLFKSAYADGYAVGHSAYDKAGVGVEAGAKATLRLKALADSLGSRRDFVGGGSMGGSIVMTLIEQHPKAFVGALSVCGVTDGWEKEVGALIDIRAVYNYYTRGTAYALPGEQDLARSALPTSPPAGSTQSGDAFRTTQTIRLALPIFKLFTDAQKDPQGPAAIIVNKVAALTQFDADPAAFGFPLITAGLGMDDMRATFGGNVYGNRGKVYASPALTAAENAAVNRGVQRLDAEPAAIRYAQMFHQTKGDFTVPLVAMHNQIDPLVPYSQLQGLEARVAAADNTQRLTVITVPPMRGPIPGSGVVGYVHCGFTPEQVANAWAALRKKVGE